MFGSFFFPKMVSDLVVIEKYIWVISIYKYIPA